MQKGNLVTIAENTSILDCCAGKRGRIVHIGIDGGWLLHTDHFCPVERQDGELILVAPEEQAQEILASKDPEFVKRYREFGKDDLLEYAHCDRLAWALLVLDHDWRPA